ncbi:MAG: hypothetical protein ACTJH9_05510 [Pseudoalteromonas sp.]|uniref:hypothetical protein n=1 Tax=unclassified Pseudoalteromonas TaxID=194690 RepID=UPI003F99787B
MLAPYFAEFDIDESTLGMSASRKPIDAGIVDLIAPFKPPVVSFHFGLPEPSIVSRIKSYSGSVISTATLLGLASL